MWAAWVCLWWRLAAIGSLVGVTGIQSVWLPGPGLCGSGWLLVGGGGAECKECKAICYGTLGAARASFGSIVGRARFWGE